MKPRTADEHHIIPLRDVILHDPNDDCICGPHGEHTRYGAWIYVHHSLDDRERHEDPIRWWRRIWKLVTRREMWRDVPVNWDE